MSFLLDEGFLLAPDNPEQTWLLQISTLISSQHWYHLNIDIIWPCTVNV